MKMNPKKAQKIGLLMMLICLMAAMWLPLGRVYAQDGEPEDGTIDEMELSPKLTFVVIITEKIFFTFDFTPTFIVPELITIFQNDVINIELNLSDFFKWAGASAQMNTATPQPAATPVPTATAAP